MRLNRSNFILKRCQHEKHNSADKKKKESTKQTEYRKQTERRYSAVRTVSQKKRKKHRSRVSFWELTDTYKNHLNFVFNFFFGILKRETWICSNVITDYSLTFSFIYFFVTEDLFAHRVNLWYLVGRVQIKREKGIMSDEMDECACYWSHEFAMRRLLALVSVFIWIFALIRWLTEKLNRVILLSQFIVETRTGLLHW